MENETINQTEQNESQNELKDERADWATPAIAEYDVQKATGSGPFVESHPNDASVGYS
jgi:hypothetical protein